MKKVFKFFGTVAILSAAAAGAVALYKKFFAPSEDFSDLDDDFDEEFEEEDLDGEAPAGERGYVSLNKTAETTKEEAADAAADTAEEEKETEAE